ncbi:hypothetical protein BASA50_000026 [Batrachochytrium salamandrivorans]|uniref:ABC transporter domain-containing protein n=1 Tax=Batrachochytrium salamandrivorans TaxID=1357716 RepID=A0ABQ8EUV1_9FUNG|nr:hypothetical protein BASA50_000026 [Batrachochytrium salamandrivorans]
MQRNSGRVDPETYVMSERRNLIQVGPSRQISALARKAVSFQKRQMFTNICCIGVCPLMMVIISAGLGSLISNLIAHGSAITESVRCANVSAMSYPGIPNWNATIGLPLLPRSNLWTAATMDNLYQTNYDVVINFNLDGPPGAATASFQHPCVFWYGENYPKSPIYEKDPGATGNAIRDSTYTAEPAGGWFTALVTGLASGAIDGGAFQRFIGLQLRSWSLYSAADADTLAFVSPLADPAVGILGTIPTRYWVDLGDGSMSGGGGNALNVQPVPWYNYSSGTDNDLDDAISAALRKVIFDISQVDKSAIVGGAKNNITATNELFLKIGKILNALPHGAVFFNKVDHANKQYSWNYHYGNDIRLTATSNFPVPGERLLHQQTQLDNAILRNSNSTTFGSASITQGLRIFPHIASSKLDLPFGGLIGSILYPFGVSFLLPVFCVILVQEKEYRVLVMMQMNGLKSIWYYTSQYITFYILFSISTAIFLIAGRLSKLTLFTLTSPGVYLLLFFLWGHNQISLAFLFSTLFNKSRFALLMVFLVVLFSVLISLTVDNIFVGGSAPIAYFLWPPFAFYRALTVINKASYSASKQPFTFSMIKPGNEVFNALIFMVGGIFVYLTLAVYLDQVIPSEFGVPRPWHFPISDIIRKSRASKRMRENGGQRTEEAELALSIEVDSKETEFEDSDVKAERNRVVSRSFDPASPLVISHMRKVYAGRGGAGPKLAVKDVTFAVEEGIVFGLLGPNGAGKTTLISILTGLYPASSGEATLAGFNIKTDTSHVYRNIGICPQFDILWEELTVSEHLYFYARLKGVPKNREKEAVDIAIRNVALIGFENRLSKGLSGGEKRRLSIAIALIGNPKVVFFDEPTTGLDPEVRRTLRCLANPIRLKQLYGAGFKLFFNALEEDMPRAVSFIESILPEGYTVIDVFATNASYEFPATTGVLPNLFRRIEEMKSSVGILDHGIGQTTLEEVFIRLISESDASAEY